MKFKICSAIASLQPFKCPVSDTEETVRQEPDGSYQVFPNFLD